VGQLVSWLASCCLAGWLADWLVIYGDIWWHIAIYGDIW